MPTPHYLEPTQCPKCSRYHFNHLQKGSCEQAAEDEQRMSRFRELLSGRASTGGTRP